MDAVPAPGVADSTAESLLRRQGGPGQVIEVVEPALLKDLVAKVELVFPRTVDADHLLGGSRLMQLQSYSLEAVDQVVVDEELPVRADIPGIGAVTRPRPSRNRGHKIEPEQQNSNVRNRFHLSFPLVGRQTGGETPCSRLLRRLRVCAQSAAKRKAYRSASLRTNRIRTGLPASELTSRFPFQVTTPSI